MMDVEGCGGLEQREMKGGEERYQEDSEDTNETN